VTKKKDKLMESSFIRKGTFDNFSALSSSFSSDYYNLSEKAIKTSLVEGHLLFIFRFGVLG